MGAEPGANGLDPGLMQNLQRFRQSVEAPVEAVVVGQAAAIDASSLQGSDVGWMQAVVHTFARPGPIAAGDCRFQVHQAQFGVELLDPAQAVSPGLFWFEGCSNRAMALLR